MYPVNSSVQSAYSLESIPKEVDTEEVNAATLERAKEIEETNSDIAFGLYAPLAESGNAFAQCKCGWMLMRGKEGVPQDVSQARHYLEAAVKNGYPEAQNELHKLDQNDLRRAGVLCEKHEYAQALPLYLHLAEQGNPEAQNKLGMLYLNGWHVSIDYQTAMGYFKIAADSGVAEGWNNMGYMRHNGLGDPVDLEVARRCYQTAADNGSAIGWYNMGYMYKHGLGGPVDLEKAMRCYQRAADSGVAEGWYNMGCLHHLDGSVDHEKAMHCFKMAADGGYAAAWGFMESMHRDGQGVPKNEDEAEYCGRMATDSPEKKDIEMRITSRKEVFSQLKADRELKNILLLLKRLYSADDTVHRFITGEVSLEEVSKKAPGLLALFKNTCLEEKGWLSKSHYLSPKIKKAMSDLLNPEWFETELVSRVKRTTLLNRLLMGEQLNFEYANLRRADLRGLRLKETELIGLYVRGAVSDDPAIMNWITYLELLNGQTDEGSLLHKYPLDLIKKIVLCGKELSAVAERNK